MSRSAPPALLLLALLAACRTGPEGGGEAGPGADSELAIEYAGCRTVLPGPVCVLPADRLLGLWARPEAGEELALEAPGSELLAREEIQGGSFFRLRLPAGSGSISLLARGAGGERSWSMAFHEQRTPAWLARAEALLAAKETEAARQLVEASLPRLPAAERGRAYRVLTTIAYRSGDFDAELGHLRRAIEANRRAERAYDELIVATNLFYRLFFANRVGEARAVLAELPRDPEGPAEAAFYLDYFPGLLAAYTGDLRAALRHLEESARQAERLRLARLRHMAEQVLGRQLQRLGRSREAAELYARLRREMPEGLTPCQRGQFLNNIAWRLLLVREAGAGGEDPRPMLLESRELFARECAELGFERANVATNLALAHLHGGEAETARAHLAEARALEGEPDLRQRLWWMDIEARIALATGRRKAALAGYRELAELAESFVLPEAQWRAAVGEARVWSALGRASEALDRFARAEALLEEESLEVPIDEGRETFVAQREWATLLHLEQLLEAGRDDEAVAVARRSRSRVLRGLERASRLSSLSSEQQRQWDAAIAAYQKRRAALDALAAGDWRLSAAELRRREQARNAGREELHRVLDQALAVLGERGRGERLPLSAPAPGELRLLYHPLPRGWVGFAEDPRGLTVWRLPDLSERQRPPELAASLLVPAEEKIARARLLRVLPYGFLRRVDFHALPFRGEVLLARLPVAYALDLGRPGAERAADGSRALVVADPNEDLPATRAEARAVEAALASWHGAWKVELLAGGAAGGQAVRRSLPEVEHFHYAGHGEFRSEDGWESALPLAAGSELTLGDILALPRAPRQVVLSGCETARTSDASAAENASGLAHAFLAAGSRGVIAAMRPVSDQLAAALASALYREWGPSVPAAEALRRAQLSLYRSDPAGDWSSFRALEP